MLPPCQLWVLRLQDLQLQRRRGVRFRMETPNMRDAIGTQLMHLILEVDMLVPGYKTYRFSLSIMDTTIIITSATIPRCCSYKVTVLRWSFLNMQERGCTDGICCGIHSWTFSWGISCSQGDNIRIFVARRYDSPDWEVQKSIQLREATRGLEGHKDVYFRQSTKIVSTSTSSIVFSPAEEKWLFSIDFETMQVAKYKYKAHSCETVSYPCELPWLPAIRACIVPCTTTRRGSGRCSDLKNTLLGAIQSLFEGSMYTFYHPLNSSIEPTWRRHILLVLSTNQLSSMLDSVFGISIHPIFWEFFGRGPKAPRAMHIRKPDGGRM